MATIGEKRVRTTFNPSADSAVDKIKNISAGAIDLVEELRNHDGKADPNEVNRCIALAQTHYETAAMYAVKAATAGKS